MPPYGYPAHADDLIAKIGDAVRRTPINWAAIRGVYLSLSGDARTDEQKSAVDSLKHASDRPGVERAATAVQRAFLEGKPGANGWPRRS